MIRDEVFKCRRLKSSLTVGRCMRNQKEALDFWGPDAGKYQSCPCDQGIDIRQQMEGTMAVRAICKNCEREMAILQEGMCGGCFGRIKGLIGEVREKALVQAKEDFKGSGPRCVGNRASRKPKDVSAPVSTRKPDRKPLPPRMDNPSIISIMVNFTDGDHAIFDGLQALSRKYRRTSEQQILWLLEKELHNERLIAPDGKEAAYGINAQVA